jgi:acyl-CoA thioester hydrolase
MVRIHSIRIDVGEDAIDVNRHVNNLSYLRWMQDAATGHSAARGWTLERYQALGAGWFVRSHFIEYLRPAFAGDVLHVHTWVADLLAHSSTRRYAFIREDDGARIAKAETRWVFVDFDSGRPVRIPADVRSDFAVVPDDDPELVALTSKTPKPSP